jgi:hypothetical protein
MELGRLERVLGIEGLTRFRGIQAMRVWEREGIPQGLKPLFVAGLKGPRLKPWGTILAHPSATPDPQQYEKGIGRSRYCGWRTTCSQMERIPAMFCRRASGN